MSGGKRSAAGSKPAPLPCPSCDRPQRLHLHAQSGHRAPAAPQTPAAAAAAAAMQQPCCSYICSCSSIASPRQPAARTLPRLLLTLALSLLAASAAPCTAAAAGSAAAGSSARPRARPTGATTLGVRTVQLFPIIPRALKNRVNHTAVMTLWLKRVEPLAAFGLPNQQRAAIRGVAWLDDPADMNHRVYGHLLLPVANHSSWQPALRLETQAAAAPLAAHVHLEHMRDKRFQEPLRPYSFRFELPVNAGSCFKIFEASRPAYKATFCLPPTGRLCASLAPPPAATDKSPALWAALTPVRRMAAAGPEWGAHFESTAMRVRHYVAYHRAMGLSGVLLYADAWTRVGLRAVPALRPLLRAGALRLVQWDVLERAHADDDGRGRPLGYNYDQALVASHALLGLSSCGTNLRVMLSDIDEYLYTPCGKRWPEVFGHCMDDKHTHPAHSHHAPHKPHHPNGPVGLLTLRRSEVHCTTVPPSDEPALWEKQPPPPQVAGAPDLSLHPLLKYDLIEPRPLRDIHSKNIALAATEVVAFFVHEGKVLHGETRYVDMSCAQLLHVRNYLGARRGSLNVSAYHRLSNWLFSAPIGGAGAGGLALQGGADADAGAGAMAGANDDGGGDGGGDDGDGYDI